MGKIESIVPVEIVTPPGSSVIHRFFDTSPFSPSGRYLGLARFPFEDRLPKRGDTAAIMVVDLRTGTPVTIDQTAAWDTQLGAHVQWGKSDRELVYNIFDEASGAIRTRVMDPQTSKSRDLDGPVYMVSPGGAQALAPNLFMLNRVQKGYGVFWAGPNEWKRHRDRQRNGVWVTDLTTGSTRLLLTIEDILTRLPQLREYEKKRRGEYVCFHVKWNPQSPRIMIVFRFGATGEKWIRNTILTAKADGSGLTMALDPERWKYGGHHPNWCPDGESILMNLKLEKDAIEFVRFRHDGCNLEVLSRNHLGSGHPTLHPDGRHILTDCYPHEVNSDCAVPLRWIDIKHDRETEIAKVPCVPDILGPSNELRIDPHPAWDTRHERIAFNCLHEGRRAVAVGDMRALL